VIKRLSKEPLLHFLLIGASLFFIFGLAQDGMPGRTDDQVIVSAGRIEQLNNIFTKTWQRPPSPAELKGMIDDFVLEEIYYRQAVEMGIDRDDTVIRRRLRQKFEFLTDDMAAASVPTDEQLAAYLAANADAFAKDTTYTFEQVYINPERAGVDLERRVAEELAALKAGNEAGGTGGMLPSYFDNAPARAVDNSFGRGFARSLDTLPLNDWQGPVESGLGLHLVKIAERVEGYLPDLADIRPIVEREWVNENRLETRRLINDQLLSNYDVVIEWPTE
jgi:hypothetical protein